MPVRFRPRAPAFIAVNILRSHVTGSTEQTAMMRNWATQHPPGSSLPVRYAPQHHNTVVPDAAGDMPELGPLAPDDLKITLILSVLSIALLTIGRVRQRRQ